MTVQRATLAMRNAPLNTDFGLDYATKLFGEEALAGLPRYQRGPKKGQLKAYLVWWKAEVGGWDRKFGVCRPGLVWAKISSDAYGQNELSGRWMGREQGLSGTRSLLSAEARAQRVRELAENERRNAEIHAEMMAEAGR